MYIYMYVCVFICMYVCAHDELLDSPVTVLEVGSKLGGGGGGKYVFFVRVSKKYTHTHIHIYSHPNHIHPQTHPPIQNTGGLLPRRPAFAPERRGPGGTCQAIHCSGAKGCGGVEGACVGGCGGGRWKRGIDDTSPPPPHVTPPQPQPLHHHTVRARCGGACHATPLYFASPQRPPPHFNPNPNPNHHHSACQPWGRRR
jgi:hypothetical protein